jgi:Replication protein A OB domain
VIGVIFELSPVSQIKMKTGEQKDKLTVVIADDTNFSVPVTLWGEICNKLLSSLKLGDVIALR